MASIIFLPQMDVLKLNVFLSFIQNKFSTCQKVLTQKRKKIMLSTMQEDCWRQSASVNTDQ